MIYWYTCKDLKVKSEWVKGDQDKGINWSSTTELSSKDLPIDATLNILCNKMASDAQQEGCPIPDAPVLPRE